MRDNLYTKKNRGPITLSLGVGGGGSGSAEGDAGRGEEEEEEEDADYHDDSATAYEKKTADGLAFAQYSVLADRVARELWEDGAGVLPPGWDFATDETGEYYYIMPDTYNETGGQATPGDSTWDDPRVNFDTYVDEFIKAAARGVDIATYR